MKYKGTFVSDLSGSLGGIVASNNKGGTYLRRKVTPINPKSAGQLRSRFALGTVSQAWRALTEYVRTTWNDAGAALNPAIQGNALWVKVNSLRGQTNLANIEFPPTGGSDPFSGNANPFAVVVSDSGQITITPATPNGWEAGGLLLVSAGLRQSNGSKISKYMSIGTSAGHGGTPYAFSLPFSVTGGQSIALKCTVQDSEGRTGTKIVETTAIASGLPAILGITSFAGFCVCVTFNCPVVIADFTKLSVGGSPATGSWPGVVPNEINFNFSVTTPGAAFLTASGLVSPALNPAIQSGYVDGPLPLPIITRVQAGPTTGSVFITSTQPLPGLVANPADFAANAEVMDGVNSIGGNVYQGILADGSAAAGQPWTLAARAGNYGAQSGIIAAAP